MTLSDIAIRRPVFTSMVILAIVVFGMVSYTNIGVDLFPKVDLPVITIVTDLPGADPETIENSITDPIENALSSISGVKHLRSVSTDGVSQVVLEFELEKNIDIAYQEVSAKIGAVRSQLPRDVDDPVIEKVDVDAVPVVSLAVSSHMPLQELTRICDREIKDRIQKIKDVGEVKLVGGRRRKIWLILDRSRLAGYNLTVQDVEQALLSQHVELPGGRLETGRVEMIVKTKAEFASAAAMENLVVATRGRDQIRLSQVGRVEDGMEEERSAAELSGQSAVSLLIQRQSGANTVAVAEAVKAEVAKMQKEYATRGIRIEIAQDMSVFIENSIEEVRFHILYGGGLAILIVFLFLRNLRSTLISALVIPTAVIGTFIMMNVLGFTQNMMTLLALSLSIGLLIDDAIVVQENIMRHVEEGQPSRKAASFGTSEITLAVFATTMSIVAVFVPVAFMKGLVGRFFFQFGLTVTFAVLISMFVSFTLDPMLSARILRKPGKKNLLFRLSENMFLFVERRYERLLAFSLRARWLILLIAVAAFFGAGYVARYIKADFLPTEDHSEFNVAVRGPLGATLDTTRATLEIIRKRIEGQPWTSYTFATIGTDSLQRVNEGTLYVKMQPLGHRAASQTDAMQWVRDHTGDLSQVQISVDQVQAINAGVKNKQLMYEVRGEDLAVLKRLSNTLMDDMRAAPGFIEIESSLEEGRPEIDIHVDRQKAADRGVDPAAIADTINALIGGYNVAKFRAEGERYDIAVRLQESQRNKVPDIGLVQVRGRDGTLVPLHDVADIRQTSGLLELDRNDRAPEITVMANLDPNFALGTAIEKMKGFIAKLSLPPGYAVNDAGQAENFRESFQYLLFALGLAVVMVYMVLASQFESFIHPFTIMLSLPLSIVGALGALAMFHMTMSIFTMIGIIMLMGLVTKNAILLVDYTNLVRHRDGLERDAAVRRAGPVRLRPILMTTFAMIFGMLPIALSHGAGSESRAPMAVAVIGGLITSTLLTLVVVPVVYTLLDDASHPGRWRIVRWFRRQPAE
ncbi:MAG: efflux RND transporter permease subunit [Planctomycetota bacterium]